MSFSTKSKTQADNQTAVSGLDIQSSAYGKVVPLVFGVNRISGNLIWYGDFTTITTITDTGSGGGGGKGGVGGGGGGKGGSISVTYTYTTSFAMGLCEGPVGNIGLVYNDKNINTPGEVGMSVFVGLYPQSPWGYLETNHSDQALGYNGVCYAASADWALGTSAQLPNLNFEVFGFANGETTNGFDAQPYNVIADLILNSNYGVNWFATAVTSISYDFAVYLQYCGALDFGISPAYVDQDSCGNMIQGIVQNTNSEFVWSGSTLTIVPYGDQSISAHGFTYTAPSAPLYSLTDDDFLANNSSSNSDDGPVVLTRKRPSDVINSIQLECLDRNNSYNPSIVQAKDQLLIDLYGIRQDTSRQAHVFCDTNTAQLSVTLQLQREQVLNTYVFTTSQRYILLDCMDIIAISDIYLGLVNQWVRIKDIQEDTDGNLTFTCEEYVDGNGNAPLYAFENSNGFTADYNSAPGNVNVPVIFDAPVQLAQGALETWLLVSGGSNWGGADVWVSGDGNTYKLAGRINGQSRQGFLTNPFPAGLDPDTVNKCSVDLTESGGTMLSGTQVDADLARTLCYCGGELIAYQTATLTGLNQYVLGTYIRRGLYGTSIVDHIVGEQFARVDSSVFSYPYDKSQIGKTVYIKFLSFNVYGGGQQSLADVSPIAHLVVGPPSPPDVLNFIAQQNGNAVGFSWNAVSDAALKGYDILYGPQGGTIDTATFLTESASGTEMTNVDVPVGTWTFYIRARDITDRFSENATMYNLTVVDTGDVIVRAKQNPQWLGTLTNLTHHYKGYLVPNGTMNCSAYTQIAAPSAPALGEIIGGGLTGATYYVKVTYINSYGSETDVSAESSFAVDTNNLLLVTSPSTEAGAIAYNVYVDTVNGKETLQNSAPILIGTNWTMPSAGLIAGIFPPESNTTGWEMFNIYVPDPVTTSNYIGPTIDTGFNDVLDVYSTSTSAAGPGQSGVPPLTFAIDTWLTGGSDPDIYTDWISGQINMRYLNGRITMPVVPGNVGYISAFSIVIDRAPRIENGANVTVSGGGTAITFPSPYHEPPFVQVTVIGSTALIGTAQSVTTTGFTAHVFNTSGSDVGGTINYEATGA